MPAGKLELLVDDAELSRRRANWKPRKAPITTGYLGRYAKQVTSASTGAVFKD
ncbi:MAG: dihydroxy-acid dehydratase [Sphaerochaetaceae bacterium]